MEEIKRQVTTARRRLILQQFLAIVPWTLFATLLLAFCGIGVTKIWPVNLDQTTWAWSWIGGSIATGLVVAGVWTYFVRCDTLNAAVEIDRRFGLKERVSSALSLAPEELETRSGQALVHDASRRIEVITVKEHFGVNGGWRTLAPIVPALAVVFVMFLADAQAPKKANAAPKADSKRLKAAAKELTRQIAKRRKSAAQKGLKEAEELFKKIEQSANDLATKDNVSRKKAMIQINDIAKQIEKRRNDLGDSTEMKRQFDKLKNLARGPADKIANALKSGDFQKALDQLKQLQEKLEKGDLSENEKKQLAKQLGQMQKKVQDIVDAQKQAKRRLEQEIQKKMDAGDLEAANKLQRKLDQLERRDRQMERMEQMAKQLGESQKSLESGDPQAAAQQLSELASELSEMQAEMDELETLNEMMDQIAGAKEMMQDGDGESDMYSEFGAMSDQYSDMPGNGMGQGRGEGFRDEEENETGEYNAREKGKLRPGEAVRVGDAFGKNRAGKTQQEIMEQIISSMNEDPDPQTDQQLPKSQRKHVNEYFQLKRDG
jgi:septal ring factor EnvC (AmiA/AmiB activator)